MLSATTLTAQFHWNLVEAANHSPSVDVTNQLNGFLIIHDTITTA